MTSFLAFWVISLKNRWKTRYIYCVVARSWSRKGWKCSFERFESIFLKNFWKFGAGKLAPFLENSIFQPEKSFTTRCLIILGSMDATNYDWYYGGWLLSGRIYTNAGKFPKIADFWKKMIDSLNLIFWKVSYGIIETCPTQEIDC